MAWKPSKSLSLSVASFPATTYVIFYPSPSIEFLDQDLGIVAIRHKTISLKFNYPLKQIGLVSLTSRLCSMIFYNFFVSFEIFKNTNQRLIRSLVELVEPADLAQVSKYWLAKPMYFGL